MIDENYLYVDKTELIHALITQGRFYFLSRPRRFGKSLLVSTLKELFLGNKRLFESLWIGKSSNYSWSEHPIIDLDFSVIARETPDVLKAGIGWQLERIAKRYSVDPLQGPSNEAKFQDLIFQLSKKNRVVILVDEYDKPILDFVTDQEIAKANREILRSFYTVIKGMDEYLRFVFLTGVTKFSQTSIFSGLNNLNDITMKPEAATLLGYTDQEIDDYLREYVEKFAQAVSTSTTLVRNEIRTWYNGYCFSENQTKVYNPFSVLYCLKDKKISNYWIGSGTPKFLVDLIKSKPEGLEDKDRFTLSAATLGAFDIEDIPLIALLFQSGYYTIQSYDQSFRKYTIGYPNREVEIAFKEYLLAVRTNRSMSTVDEVVSLCHEALLKNDINRLCSGLRTLFANIPYNLHLKHESYYHSLFQLLGTTLGLETTSEVPTDKGRVDVVIKTPQYLYIFEVKFNKEVGVGTEQIERKRYYEKYMYQGKKIILVEMLFKRTQDDFTIDCKVQDLDELFESIGK